MLEGTAYVYDGSLEGLLTAVFTAYERKQMPDDIATADRFTARLGQEVVFIDTDIPKAERVRRTLTDRFGSESYRAVLKASLSGDVRAGISVFRYIDHLLQKAAQMPCKDCKRHATCALDGEASRARCFTFKSSPAMSDIADAATAPIFEMVRSVNNECEKMRQFVRFEHLALEDAELWFARINPKHSVVPLIMGHFVERFNVQPFVIYDEVHGIAGVYEGREWFLVPATDEMIAQSEKRHAREEELVQEAWRMFYRSVSIDSRYHPELRRNLMQKRFWKNLTEMRHTTPSSLQFLRS